MSHINFTINGDYGDPGAEMCEHQQYSTNSTVKLLYSVDKPPYLLSDYDVKSNMSNNLKDNANMAVRKLPKKRKYDPSELEEVGKLSNDIHEIAPLRNSPVPVPVVHPHPQVAQQNFVIVPPQSAAVDYSFRENTDCSMHNSMNTVTYLEDHQEAQLPQVSQVQQTLPDLNNCLSVINSVSNGPSRKHTIISTIDLSEWRDHRVLAKQDTVYLPGVIRKASLQGEIWVELDYYEGKQLKFSNVLTTGKYDVIGDASPSMRQLAMGSRICVRQEATIDNISSGVFLEGVVCNILNNPTRYVVRVQDHQHGDEITVKRADLRLMQPPWWDELADFNSEPVNTVSLNGQNFVEERSYPGVMQTSLLQENSSLPLQLHQVSLILIIIIYLSTIIGIRPVTLIDVVKIMF